MMNRQIYFDEKELSTGRYYTLEDPSIKTKEGDLYEVEGWIARGGNASIFRGRQRVTGEECAIKFLLRSGSDNFKRFRREIRLLELMKDDHIVQYHGSGLASVKGHWQKVNSSKRRTRLPFIVMELANSNLRSVIRNRRKLLSYEEYAGQFRGLANALALLHTKVNAIHRDIKPENILAMGERWVLSDYGLCTFINPGDEDLTPAGRNPGPRYWLSPEAHNRRLGNGDEISAASDVFQLAAVFWYVATRKHPSGIITREDWIGPDKLFDLLHRSLYHNQTKRPQNGSVFLQELEDALEQ